MLFILSCLLAVAHSASPPPTPSGAPTVPLPVAAEASPSPSSTNVTFACDPSDVATLKKARVDMPSLATMALHPWTGEDPCGGHWGGVVWSWNKGKDGSRLVGLILTGLGL